MGGEVRGPGRVGPPGKYLGKSVGPRGWGGEMREPAKRGPRRGAWAPGKIVVCRGNRTPGKIPMGPRRKYFTGKSRPREEAWDPGETRVGPEIVGAGSRPGPEMGPQGCVGPRAGVGAAGKSVGPEIRVGPPGEIPRDLKSAWAPGGKSAPWRGRGGN